MELDERGLRQGWSPEPEELTSEEKARRDLNQGALKELALKIFVVTITLRTGEKVEVRLEGYLVPPFITSLALEGYKTDGDVEGIDFRPLPMQEQDPYPKNQGKELKATSVFDVVVVYSDGSKMVVVDIPSSLRQTYLNLQLAGQRAALECNDGRKVVTQVEFHPGGSLGNSLSSRSAPLVA